MECPICKGVQLVMSERQGIEIDYCPQCRGVWLDRGELDKIIEKSAVIAPPPRVEGPASSYGNPPHAGHGYPNSGHEDHYRDEHGEYYKKRKRGGFLADLFDFD